MAAGSSAADLLAPAPAADRRDRRRIEAPAKRAVAVVVPTYNEADNLPRLVDRVFSCLPDDAMLIVVDDGSPDGTGALATQLAERSPGAIELVQRDEKLGLGTAYRAGFQRALASGADYVVQMDADLSHDPDSLFAMLAELSSADVVVGSRYVAGASVDPRWGPVRRLLSVAGNRGIGLLAGLHVRDATSGFKAFRARRWPRSTSTASAARASGSRSRWPPPANAWDCGSSSIPYGSVPGAGAGPRCRWASWSRPSGD